MGSAALDGASGPAAGPDVPGLAIARRLTTRPSERTRSSTTSCVRCFSRCLFTRSTASGSTELMWLRTSATPIAWNSPTTCFGSRFNCLATS